jgi:hypothetical protein
MAAILTFQYQVAVPVKNRPYHKVRRFTLRRCEKCRRAFLQKYSPWGEFTRCC